jgi:hypothetical protein
MGRAPVPMTTAELRAELRLGVVAVVGVGLSLGARYPDTHGLNARMWDAIDSDTDARPELTDRLRRPGAPAKVLVGDRNEAWAGARQLIAGSQPARASFEPPRQWSHTHRRLEARMAVPGRQGATFRS